MPSILSFFRVIYERDNLRLYWTAALTESVSDGESDFSAEIVWDLSAAAY